MIVLITCFHGRHEKVERIIRCFINQTYTEDVELLLFNNSSVPQKLDYEQIGPLLSANKNIRLINNHIDYVTNEPYTNVGDIFRDAVSHVYPGSIISFFDSDDIFLPNHVEEGYKGYQRAMLQGCSPDKKQGYKPYYSYYLFGDNQIELSHNTMEPSIFTTQDWVFKKGFKKENASYHQGWEEPLKNGGRLFIDKEGVPTFIYDWSKGHGTHKISGLGDTIDNFKAHREYECDHGDGILSCAPQSIVQKYYDLVNQYNDNRDYK